MSQKTLQGTFAPQSVGQQQLYNYSHDNKCEFTVKPSMSCKDSSKNPAKQDVARHILLDGINKNPQENRLFSPVSASAVLNMLIPGSNGQTRDQFVDLLCLEEKELNNSSIKLLDAVRPFKGVGGPHISLSNSVWVDHQFPLMRSYKELLENVHAADVNSVDLLYKVHLLSIHKFTDMLNAYKNLNY